MNDLAAFAPGLPAPERRELTRKAKAAIIVQFLLNENSDVPLASLPEEHQEELTMLLGNMRYVDRETLNTVVQEFADELDGVGMAFPGGMANALEALEGKISAQTAIRLRKEAGVRQVGNPWDRINAQPLDRLVMMVESESIQVAAVIMSKIEVSKAAEVLAKLPGDRARRISYAVSMTNGVTPDAVDRIGISLAAQMDAEPPKAFEAGPPERLGAILNYAATATRDEMLESLESEDSVFADAVRKSIFTFADIPARLKEIDVSKITRDVDQDIVATAIAAATTEMDRASVDFMLENMSKRMATGLREEADAKGEVGTKAGEKAMGAIVGAIRDLITAGEIELKTSDDDE